LFKVLDFNENYYRTIKKLVVLIPFLTNQGLSTFILMSRQIEGFENSFKMSQISVIVSVDLI
jgi:glucose uptake protein GlcU